MLYYDSASRVSGCDGPATVKVYTVPTLEILGDAVFKMTKTSSFTSESVCAGHPDKICDQISDAVVDAILSGDKYGKVAVETLVTENRIILAGEVSSNVKIDYVKIAREQIKRLGYVDEDLKFNYNSPVNVYIHEQSNEIAVGVRKKGAGDQGMMFGYACRDTPDFMPVPIALAHALVKRIDNARESKVLDYLRPDGKSQVTVEYVQGEPKKLAQVVLAVPHRKNVDLKQVTSDLFEFVVKPVAGDFGFFVNRKSLTVNGTGVWHFSGPAADTGVTGRKIVVDTYGGYARVGGGAFSGKDPTKVDRSGAYAARFIAKNIVANCLADKAEVMIAYIIGAKKPLMLEVETFGTARKSSSIILDFAKKIIDLSVEGIIERMDLRRPIYLPTACYGHFGRAEFPWEKVVQLTL